MSSYNANTEFAKEVLRNVAQKLSNPAEGLQTIEDEKRRFIAYVNYEVVEGEVIMHVKISTSVGDAKIEYRPLKAVESIVVSVKSHVQRFNKPDVPDEALMILWEEMVYEMTELLLLNFPIDSVLILNQQPGWAFFAHDYIGIGNSLFARYLIEGKEKDRSKKYEEYLLKKIIDPLSKNRKKHLLSTKHYLSGTRRGAPNFLFSVVYDNYSKPRWDKADLYYQRIKDIDDSPLQTIKDKFPELPEKLIAQLKDDFLCSESNDLDDENDSYSTQISVIALKYTADILNLGIADKGISTLWGALRESRRVRDELLKTEEGKKYCRLEYEKFKESREAQRNFINRFKRILNGAVNPNEDTLH